MRVSKSVYIKHFPSITIVKSYHNYQTIIRPSSSRMAFGTCIILPSDSILINPIPLGLLRIGALRLID